MLPDSTHGLEGQEGQDPSLHRGTMIVQPGHGTSPHMYSTAPHTLLRHGTVADGEYGRRASYVLPGYAVHVKLGGAGLCERGMQQQQQQRLQCHAPAK